MMLPSRPCRDTVAVDGGQFGSILGRFWMASWTRWARFSSCDSGDVKGWLPLYIRLSAVISLLYSSRIIGLLLALTASVEACRLSRTATTVSLYDVSIARVSRPRCWLRAEETRRTLLAESARMRASHVFESPWSTDDSWSCSLLTPPHFGLNLDPVPSIGAEEFVST